jgi:hypothetical protein
MLLGDRHILHRSHKLTQNAARTPTAIIAVIALLGLAGCGTRVISITSEPPGALVHVNDVEVGRTPVDTTFKHFGTYDVRVNLEGFEPIAGPKEAEGSWRDAPVLDLVTFRAGQDVVVPWHFVLQPLPERTNRPQAEQALLERARQFRSSQLSAEAPAQAPNPPPLQQP